MKNDLFLKALRRQPVERTPIWIMRQAGRYLPEYRKIREAVPDFMTLCRTPELTCEVALQPLRRFDLDAAIVFSDILTIPDAMGLGLQFKPGEGPVFERPIRTEKDIERLSVPDVEDDLGYVMKAVKLLSDELKGELPVIGFSGSPWTLATYMVEGQSSKHFSKVKGLMYRSPLMMARLLDVLAESVAHYLRAQANAGADVLMIFDSWGGVLAQDAYHRFSLPYMKKIVDALSDLDQPVILFTKGGGQWLESMADTGCAALGVDWGVNIGDARRRVGDCVALQGNMDPSMLYAHPDRIRQEAHKILSDFGGHPGHIFNLGHGILPDVPPEHVQVLVDAVREGGVV